MSDRVEVVGVGVAAARPDVATVSLRVESSALSVAVALDGVSEASGALFAALTAGGVAPADVQTAGVRVDSRWNHRTDTDEGFTAGQSVTVWVRAIDRLGALITAASVGVGDALRLESVAWDFADPAPIAAAARAAAWDDAVRRATHYAELAGRSLGEVRRIEETTGADTGPRPMAKAMVAAARDLPIEAGESSIETRLRVRWSLTD